MCLDSLLGGGSKSAERQSQIQFNITRDDAMRREAETKAEEAARQDRIRQGQTGIDSAFSGFNDGYFDNYRNQYNEYYTPKLKEQYDQAKQDLTYGLAGKGLTQSSIGAKLFGDLQKKFDDANLQIGSQASDAARSLRGNIESNKNDLYALNQSSADPSAISTRAAASSRALTAAPTFTPLGDVFGSALGAAASALQADRKSLAPQIASPNVFNGGSKSSGRVVS